MKPNFTKSAGSAKELLVKTFTPFLLLLIGIVAEGQQYTETFSSAPTFTAYPGTPSWQQTATVTQGSTLYDFITAGNGGWEYKPNGGSRNSASLLYSTNTSTTVTIKRKDGKRFQFYGAWLKYTNLANSFTAPWLRVSYDGSTLSTQIYNNNTTITLAENVNVTSVILYFSGLENLNFDNIIVGPATPVKAVSGTDEVSSYSDSEATLSGYVSDDGGAPVTESGIVYGTASSPTTSDNKLALSTGVNTFSHTVTGLLSSTTYYVRSYAVNSAGTAYGNEESFTTFGPFVIDGTHNFNTAWTGLYYQSSPSTKYIEGWDVTGMSTGTGVISFYKLTGADAAEGPGSLRVADDEYSESLSYVSMKNHSSGLFSLKSFVFRYDVQEIGASNSFSTITITGYKNGLAVPGAVQTITSISPSSDDASYHSFTANANIFNGIDEFRVSASGPVNDARLYDIDLDEIVTATNSSLPVTFTSVKAFHKNDGVEVDWNVTMESDVDHYEIEKSVDGTHFLSVGKLSPSNNNYLSANYSWFDSNTDNDKSYYRVKSVFKTGNVTYSQIMVIGFSSTPGSISVYPNPVPGGTINLRLNNQVKGLYTIELFNIDGQRLFHTTIVHNGGSSSQTISIDKGFIKGVYQLKVSSLAGSFMQKIVKE